MPVVVGKFLSKEFHLRGCDKPHPEGNLLNAGDLEALSGLDGLHVVGSLDQGFDRTGVEPGESSAEDFNVELPASR